MNEHILLVDDDPVVTEVIQMYLLGEGFQVSTLELGNQVLHFLGTNLVDLVLLDVMLPDFNGHDLAKEIRVNYDIPILFVSAKGSDVDKAVGLAMGGDDYITKPVSPIELLARVKAHLRRYQRLTNKVVKKDHQACLQYYGLQINIDRREVVSNGASIQLTNKEFDVLFLLAQRPGQIFSKAQIYDQVWGQEFLGDENTVAVTIKRLRNKIEPEPVAPTYILTKWGIGYYFNNVTAN